MTELAAGFSDSIKNALAVLPDKPGVYLMHDAEGKVIYVGKAVVLKNRVRSYFRNLASHTPKVRAMVAKIAEIETIVTSSEVEALILECNLIKKYRPRYNISLKDDKTYPYLKVTVQEDFPRLFATRRLSRDGAKYYGPYADAGAMHATVKLLRGMFPLRTCRKMNPDRPCLNYHIKRCLAPCAGYVSKDEYRKMIQSVCMVLDGRTTELERDLKRRMQEAAENYAFEEAARLRDQLQAVERLNESQKAVTNNGGDMDVIGYGQDMTGICLQIFFVRKGKLIGRDNFFLHDDGDEPREVLTAFVKQYYNEATFIPKEIILPYLPEEDELRLITSWLTEKAQRKVELLTPQRGVKKDLLQLADDNAAKLLEERLRKGSLSLKNDAQAAEELQQALGLPHSLERMDCFDISHTQGSETVASMVVFRNGSVSKKDYRKYKIVSAEGKPDDFKSMQEVVYRRYKDYEDLPSLVVIDGGKGQLSSALEVIRGLGLAELPVVGLAKREEEIFVPHQSESILLDRDSAALHLIQRIRDEAHRFAITYHRKLRGKRNLVSVLDHVEGIGPKRRQELWKAFKTLDAMKAADVEALAAVEGMNRAAAQTLYDFFRLELPEKKEILK
ncbi:MAG: excinuclease ABC subunit UvrC [Phascolarctobacterium sp.]|uniref:excinuclease ABC subunit UvrC n=1 Tax=Phascolarctobacterium sp. TaxID=2049039 RepID=UPI0026DB870E|nr:excinuclease ABC subunit UvrC [Phascolarctobacterium sp.]MDO4920680.1 excinuclease ABC subunit UvrC [Phascolarctobacterium sp.]